MLYLDTTLELHGVTIFRDYNSQNRYYYLPNSPHISREAGQPMFQLLIYPITDFNLDTPKFGIVAVGLPPTVSSTVRWKSTGATAKTSRSIEPVHVDHQTA